MHPVFVVFIKEVVFFIEHLFPPKRPNSFIFSNLNYLTSADTIWWLIWGFSVMPMSITDGEIHVPQFISATPESLSDWRKINDST